MRGDDAEAAWPPLGGGQGGAVDDELVRRAVEGGRRLQATHVAAMTQLRLGVGCSASQRPTDEDVEHVALHGLSRATYTHTHTSKNLEVDGLLEPRGQLLLASPGQQCAHEDAEVVPCATQYTHLTKIHRVHTVVLGYE
jgi:hypothetical protein